MESQKNTVPKIPAVQTPTPLWARPPRPVTLLFGGQISSNRLMAHPFNRFFFVNLQNILYSPFPFIRIIMVQIYKSEPNYITEYDCIPISIPMVPIWQKIQMNLSPLPPILFSRTPRFSPSFQQQTLFPPMVHSWSNDISIFQRGFSL